MRKFPYIEIDLKTDILAFAAFVMALGGVLVQGYHFVRGAQVTLFPPEQVIMIFYQYHPKDEKRYLRLGARVAYTNDGETGHNAVVEKETISFELDGVRYEQQWQSVHKFTGTEASVKTEYISEAKPEPIQAGNAISREIYFAPHSIRCTQKQPDCNVEKNYLTGIDFLNGIAGLEQLKITISSKLFDVKKPIRVSCLIDVDTALIGKLAAFGSAAPSCWPESS
ncbi:hypothetical protein [Terasakiella sp. SH-1]|uniref:hypothetical protein n=1 Tax=Terasakiella sp. SH-1 TaxID=2560057 RepID=UPI001073B277|nr:hypothetical protein [Terasakiella sp. SH-1]